MKKLYSLKLNPKLGKSFYTIHDLENSHNNKVSNQKNKLLLSNGESYLFDRDTPLKNTTSKQLQELQELQEKKVKEDYKKFHPRSLKNNTNITYGGLLTFGNESQNLTREEMDKINQEDLFNSSRDYIFEVLENLGLKRENLLYFVQHNDETQIHFQFKIIGYDFDNHKIIRNDLTPSRMEKLQDIGEKHFLKRDIDIYRGISKKERIKKELEKKGLSYEDYSKLSKKQKHEIKIDSNVVYRDTRQNFQNLKLEYVKSEKDIKGLNQQKISLMEIFQKIQEEKNQGIKDIKIQREDFKKIEMDTELKKIEYSRMTEEQNKLREDLKSLKDFMSEYSKDSEKYTEKFMEKLFEKHQTQTPTWELLEEIGKELEKKVKLSMIFEDRIDEMKEEIGKIKTDLLKEKNKNKRILEKVENSTDLKTLKNDLSIEIVKNEPIKSVSKVEELTEIIIEKIETTDNNVIFNNFNR